MNRAKGVAYGVNNGYGRRISRRYDYVSNLKENEKKNHLKGTPNVRFKDKTSQTH